MKTNILLTKTLFLPEAAVRLVVFTGLEHELDLVGLHKEDTDE